MQMSWIGRLYECGVDEEWYGVFNSSVSPLIKFVIFSDIKRCELVRHFGQVSTKLLNNSLHISERIRLV